MPSSYSVLNKLGILLTLLAAYCTAQTIKIQAISASPGLIKIRWRSSLEPNASLEFRILLNDKLPSTCKEPLNKTSYLCEINGNIPNSAYVVQLSMCNLDETDASKCVRQSDRQRIFVPPEAPSSYTAVAHENQSIEFVWETPAQNTRGLTIGLFAWKQEDIHTSTIQALEGSQTGFLVGLSPLTVYNTTVCSQNPGENLKECSGSITTVLTAPNAPAVNITEVGVNWIAVKFEQIQNGESFGLVYTALSTDAKDTQSNCSTMASKKDVSCKIEELQAATDYIITAMACVNTTCSVQSTAITVMTLPEEISTAPSSAPPMSTTTQSDEISTTATSIKPTNATSMPTTMQSDEISTTPTSTTPTSPASDGKGTLSGGAIAGIVLAVVVVVIFLVILLVHICTREPKDPHGV